MVSKLVSNHTKNTKVVFNKQLGILFNGEDNLYPLIISNLMRTSVSAFQCGEIYKSFLIGSGFETSFNLDKKGNLLNIKTPNDLLVSICNELKEHQAVYIHIGYNANYEKTEFNVVPYNHCRLGKKDSKNYSGKILVHPDGWEKRVDKKKLKVFDVYNPSPVAIREQVEATEGGWNNYKGQILYFQLDDTYFYSKSLLESAYLYADTESEMALFYNSTVKKGFEDGMIIRHKKFSTQALQTEFENNLKAMSGLRNASSKLMVQDDFDHEKNEDSKFKFDFIKNETKPDKYKHFEETASNMIRKAFKNIPPQIIDYVKGKLGNTSGEDLKAAEAIYNKATASDRQKITLLFTELYNNFENDINPTNNWDIGLYSLLDDGTVEEEGEGSEGKKSSSVNESSEDEKLRKQAQATLRGSVGGVTGILSIQNSVSTGVTSFDSGLAMLEEIYGYSTEVASRILGNVEKQEDGTTNTD